MSRINNPCFQKLSTTDWENFIFQNPNVKSVDLFIIDSNGICRGKRVPSSEMKKICTQGVCLPRSIFCGDITGESVDSTKLIWECGDLDFNFYIDAQTLCIEGSNKDKAQAILFANDDQVNTYDPRWQLLKLEKKLHKLKLLPVCAVELEFYLLKQHQDGTYHPALGLPGGFESANPNLYDVDRLDLFEEFFQAVYKAAKAQNLPVGSIVNECGAGQFEVNLKHVNSMVKAADDAIYLKRLIKKCAQEFGLRASFMPKPFAHDPSSGMHIHISLYDEKNNNVFESNFDGKVVKGLFAQAVAGMQKLMQSSMIFAAPSANAYKRFGAESFTPNRVSWGFNNRTVSLRITQRYG